MKLTFYDEKRDQYVIETRVHICWTCGGTGMRTDKPSLACNHCFKGIALDEGSWKDLEPEEVQELKTVIRQRHFIYRRFGSWELPKSISAYWEAS